MPAVLVIPRALVEMHAKGLFDYWGGRAYGELTDDERVDRMERARYEVLWWRTIEWDLSPNEVAAWKGDGLLRPGLFPFAGDGYGNRYCWFPKWQEGAEPPVVFAVHDEMESRTFARDFSECLFRLLVQHVGWYAVDDELEGDPAVDWREYARLIRPWLAETERDAVDQLGIPSPARCRELDEDLEARYAGRRLVGLMPASKYDDAIPHQHLVRAYDEAIGQFRELIAEGYAELSGALEEAERNRARVAGRER